VVVPAVRGGVPAQPHHVRAFILPPELSPAVWGSAFRDDPRFAAFFAHPWHATGDNLATWAYFTLVSLGLPSFRANRHGSLGARALVWVGFGALAAWNARLVPFFAVVAAPITAMNYRDVMSPGFLNRTGRTLTLTISIYRRI